MCCSTTTNERTSPPFSTLQSFPPPLSSYPSPPFRHSLPSLSPSSMAADTRARIKRLIVINPDESGSDHDNPLGFPLPSYTYQPPYLSISHTQAALPGPLATDQTSRDHFLNPSLSSPSDTGETPPPSTPGPPAQVSDVPTEISKREEYHYPPDRPLYDPPSQPKPLPAQNFSDNSNRLVGKPRQTILATIDLRNYVPVDISNVNSGMAIRDCIFAKVCYKSIQSTKDSSFSLVGCF